MRTSNVERRTLLGVALAVAISVVGFALLPGAALAQQKLKVAAIYTVPVEQQWVSRIHKALNAAKDAGEIEYVFSESVSNADYERVMPVCGAGQRSDRRGSVRGGSGGAQGREGLSEDQLPARLVG